MSGVVVDMSRVIEASNGHETYVGFESARLSRLGRSVLLRVWPKVNVELEAEDLRVLRDLIAEYERRWGSL